MLVAQEKTAFAAIKIIANQITSHTFEVQSIADVKAEIFGPVLQVVGWDGYPEDVIPQINALGDGLTPSIQTCTDSRAQASAAPAPKRVARITISLLRGAGGVGEYDGGRGNAALLASMH